MSELRWNPLLGEWLATATQRQNRTFLPPANFCPLCPTKPGGFPTEIPAETYDIVVFENRWPSLRPDPPEPDVEPTPLYPVRPGVGECEVVVYTPQHSSSLAQQPVEQILKLIQVWTDRFVALSSRDYVDYVFIFENKGEPIGVTLHHPHGQIYAYPFIPPVIARELATSLAHWQKHGRCLICDIVDEEIRDGRRVVLANDSFVAYMPFFARFPYEVHIVPRRHVQAISDLERSEQSLLAEAIKQTIAAYDRLYDKSFPYMMLLHGRPSDGGNYEHYHFHIEFLPLLRTPTKQKYLAGSESGAGVFVTDALPEEKAAEIRAHLEPVRWADDEKEGERHG